LAQTSAQGFATAEVREDRIRQPGNQAFGKVVPHAGHQLELRPRNAAAQVMRRRGEHQRVGRTMDDSRR
jgi:hypothetical protein